MKSNRTTEQLGKSEGGKEPPSRSINQFFELFQSSKNCLSGAKRLFRHAGCLRKAQTCLASYRGVCRARVLYVPGWGIKALGLLTLAISGEHYAKTTDLGAGRAPRSLYPLRHRRPFPVRPAIFHRPGLYAPRVVASSSSAMPSRACVSPRPSCSRSGW